MSARSEIENTLYRLAWGTDRRESDYITDAYTSDATWVRELADQVDVVEGRDAIVSRMQATWEKTPPTNSKHVISNVVIEREDDHQADVTSYKTVVRLIEGKPTVASSGWYRDEFVNDGGTWRIKKRTLAQEGSI